MAEERERRPYQPDAQGRELQLEQPKLGKRAYHFIQAFRLALDDTPEFQQKYHEQDTMWKRQGEPHVMLDNWGIDFEKGDYHHHVFFSRYPKTYTKTKVGEDTQLLIIEKGLKEHYGFPQYAGMNERVLLQASYDKNGEDIQFDSGAISHRDYTLGTVGHPYTFRYPSNDTPTAVQRVEEFFRTNFGDPILYTPPYK